jgi:type IV secretion system protein VirD4
MGIPWRRVGGWAAGSVGLAWAVGVAVLLLHGLTTPTWARFLAAGGWMPWRLVPWLAAHPTEGHFAAILAAGAAAWLGWILWPGHQGAAPGGTDLTRTFARKDTAYGSGRWRADREIAPALARWPLPKAVPASAPGGIVVGQRGRDSVLLTADQHVALVGIPGVGKTRRVILPTIGCLGAARESIVLSDPKGELYAYTADWLAAQGYQVVRLDLRDPSRSTRWNPLAPVQAAWAANQPATASRAAWQLAHALVGSGATKEALWNQTTEALIAALVLAVVTTAEPAAQHLHSAYRLLLELGDGLDQFFQALPDRHPAREAYRTVQSAQQETRSSIHVTTTATLRLFSDPNIAWLTATHDAAWPMGQTAAAVLARFSAVPMAIFLVIPDEDSTLYPLVTLALTQLIGSLVEASAQAPGGRLPRRVNFLLDEFGNLPALPDFDKAVNVGRGRGLRFLVAVQSWPQFAAVYQDKGSVIANGCAVTIYLGTNDIATAQEFSQRVGSATVQTETRGGTVVSTQAVGRSLLTPDELLRWPVGRSLVLQLGQLPLALDLPDLSAWPWPFAPADPAPPRDLSAEAAELAVFPPPMEDDWGAVALEAPWDP